MKNLAPRRMVRTNTLLVGTALCVGSYSAVLAAQQQPNTPLPKLPGLTAIQQPVANAIDTVCPNLAFVLNIIPYKFKKRLIGILHTPILSGNFSFAKSKN